jgi:hypothetical protein
MADQLIVTSIGYDQQVALVQEKMQPQDAGGLRVFHFKATIAVVGTILAQPVLKMPAGKVLIIPALCGVYIDDLAAATTLDLGYAAHTDETGTAVAAVADRIFDGLVVAAGPTAANGLTNVVAAGTVASSRGTNATQQPFTLNSQSGFNIVLTVQGGDVDAITDVLEGWIVFAGGTAN